jgi:hypothetical protein
MHKPLHLIQRRCILDFVLRVKVGAAFRSIIEAAEHSADA